jgi:hypothetical protein
MSDLNWTQVHEEEMRPGVAWVSEKPWGNLELANSESQY